MRVVRCHMIVMDSIKEVVERCKVLSQSEIDQIIPDASCELMDKLNDADFFTSKHIWQAITNSNRKTKSIKYGNHVTTGGLHSVKKFQAIECQPQASNSILVF